MRLSDLPKRNQKAIRKVVQSMNPTERKLPEAAICRMLCIYIVTSLSEKYIKDACHALGDIYGWQVNEAFPNRQPPIPTQHPVSGVTWRQKTPFTED